MTELPDLRWYDNPILLWTVELIALGPLLGTFGRDRSAVADVVVVLATIAALGALNLAIAHHRARRT